MPRGIGIIKVKGTGDGKIKVIVNNVLESLRKAELLGMIKICLMMVKKYEVNVSTC